MAAWLSTTAGTGNSASTAATVWISSNTATTSATTISSAMANALYSSQHLTVPTASPLVMAVRRLMGDCSIEDGEECRITLPDGGVLEVAADGSYVVNDANSKVIYRANRLRDFNSFMNASDKIEEFIRFCGAVGVRQGDMLGIPLKHFIAWLVLEAAKADGEPEPDLLLLPDLRRTARPHCATCGRFLAKKLKSNKIEFCRPRCFEEKLRVLDQKVT